MTRSTEQVLAELAELIPPVQAAPTRVSPPFDLDRYWRERDQLREDHASALGEPDLIDGWLVAGRRAVWAAGRS